MTKNLDKIECMINGCMSDLAASVSAQSIGRLLIWDSESQPPSNAGTIVLWRSFSPKSSSEFISIPQLIEDNSDALRARYLAWVYELGEFRVQGQRLIDHLELRPGFSYWWMTLLAEKCSYSKSPQIIEAIRMLAFTDWIAGHTFVRITLVTANQPLADCLRRWSENVGAVFEWHRLSKPRIKGSWRAHVYSSIPSTAQALVWLLNYLLERWQLQGVGLQSWRQSSATATFVSYLFNLEPEAVKIGRYESRYWGPLPELLKGNNYKTNWLHMYLKDGLLPDARSAAVFIRELNKKSLGKTIHATLDSFLSFRVVIRALHDWFKLVWISKELNGPLSAAFARESINLWPLFCEDWRQSTCGLTAISNTLFSSLFHASLASLPKQHIGCYLQENQGWEFAFIQHWRLFKHGHVVGVPHSSVRFWDLRYFFDSRSYHKSECNLMPLPDQVAINGHLATKAYLAGGYPAKDLVQVEALRYLYLNNINFHTTVAAEAPKKDLRLLVLGDYLASSTRLQMRMLAQAADELPTGTVITVKPHPACTVSAGDYPELQLNVTTEPLENLLDESDVVYSSAVTTAALEAYCAGVPVISLLDPNGLNMSPLRGQENVRYVCNACDLIYALAIETSCNRSTSRANSIFILDKYLPRWLKLFYSHLNQ
jgi:surface carbohydrate biosynthesis protein (TIGR04326 family)